MSAYGYTSIRLVWATEGAGRAQAGCQRAAVGEERAHKTKDGERTDTSFSQQSLAAPAPLRHVTPRLSFLLPSRKQGGRRSAREDAERTSFSSIIVGEPGNAGWGFFEMS